MEELITRILNTIDKKKVKSLCNRILKKCSFKSENDLRNISSLATWLYIYGYYEEMNGDFVNSNLQLTTENQVNFR